MHIRPCNVYNRKIECRNVNQTRLHTQHITYGTCDELKVKFTCRKWQASGNAHMASAHVELQVLCNGFLSVQLHLHWPCRLLFPMLADERRSSRRRSRTVQWRRREQIVEETLGPLNFLMDNKYSVNKYEGKGNDQYYVFSTTYKLGRWRKKNNLLVCTSIVTILSCGSVCYINWLLIVLAA